MTVRASVVVNNYNYGRYLRAAIDSALAQTHRDTEVIVVDDGSRDESRDIIASYGERVFPVLKENGGQASAINAGFEASRGEVVIFLDADDVLKPTAVEVAVGLLSGSNAVKAHWPLTAIDVNGYDTGRVICENIPSGDWRSRVARDGMAAVVSPPTSGNAWRRDFLRGIMPIPEGEFQLCADAYLFTAAAAMGDLAATCEPLSCYRIHGQNLYYGYLTEGKLEREIARFESLFGALRRFLPCGDEDVYRWREASFFHRIARAMNAIAGVTRPGSSIVLFDECQWAVSSGFRERVWVPFTEADGHYAGPPADDAAAMRELRRLCDAGAEFAVVAWPAFWWLDYYRVFFGQLRSQKRLLAETEEVLVFDLA